MAEAKAAAAKGPVRYTSPYDFMQSPTNGMTAIGPPWSEITAYDLNTGEIKWRIPDGGVTAPAEANIPAEHRRAHAARRTARHGWRLALRGDRVGPHGACLRSRDGQGRVEQRSADRVGRRAGDATKWTDVSSSCSRWRPAPDSSRLASADPHLRAVRAGGCAAGGGPEAQAARGAGAGAGGGGRGRGGAPPAPGAYIAYALPRK